MNQTILYILMRNDLPSMNTGKAMAQASHASAQFVERMKNENDLSYSQWINEGYGFGTTVVLEGSKNNIIDFMSDSLIKGYNERGDVIDDTYPFKAQKEILDLMNKDDIIKYNINIIDNIVDKFGMVSCTRIEHTCSWIFFSGNDLELEFFKNILTEHNLVLHR